MWTKKTFLLVILFSILFIAAASALPGKYLASRLRVPFHYPSCEWAQKIAPENRQWFQTRQQAISAGHRPCKVCNP